MRSSIDQQVDYFTCETPTYGNERIEFMRPLVAGLPEGGRVIDVGCGDGAVLATIATMNDSVERAGLEPSPAYVEIANEKDPSANVRQGSLLARADLEPFDGAADLVLVVSVLHHLVGNSRAESRALVGTALENCRAMLRPDGRLVVFEPAHGPSWLMAVIFMVKRLVTRFTGPHRLEAGPVWANLGAPLVSYYTPEELRRALADAGFEVEATHLVDSTTLGGIIRRERVGIVARARGTG